MNLRIWLIKKLGGVLLPEQGCIFIHVQPWRAEWAKNTADMVNILGGVPLPKANEGQYLRRPSICKKPVRKSNLEIKRVFAPENENMKEAIKVVLTK
jgi:hypothetical protein